MTVCVVNSGVANVRSVVNMLRRHKAAARIVERPEELTEATAIVLPGVGSYDAAMKRLRNCGLYEVLSDAALNQRLPFLGLCLGMQLMAEGSEEGVEPGFGWIPGRFLRLKADQARRLRVPHMGWNIVRGTDGLDLYAGMGDEPRFYFDHSYHYPIDGGAEVCGVSRHGVDFAAGIRSGNLCGFQFHPEKSHRFGFQLFANFLAHVERHTETSWDPRGNSGAV